MGATAVARILGWRQYERGGGGSDVESSSQSYCSLASVSSTDSLITHSQATPISHVYKSGGAGEPPCSPINRLPTDLLLRIFSFLDVISLCRCAQVSKMWHELALDGSNWQHIDLFDFQIDIKEQVIERLSQRCGGFLRSLSLRGCEDVQDSAVSTFSKHCHNLDILTFTNCHRLTDIAIEGVANNCHALQHLNISSCRNITDVSCQYIALVHPRYISLEAFQQNNRGCTERSVHYRRGCNNLQFIDLSYCSITHEGVASLVGGCGQLKSILLEYCTEVSDESLREIATHCPSLVRLQINGCKKVTDAGITCVSESCSKLERLGISRIEGLTDLSLRNLAEMCPNLRDVEAAGCAHFTDGGLTALANGCPRLSRMDLEECVLISDVSITKLASNCTNLKSLALSHCERITDASIEAIVNSNCADTIKVIELDNCPLISDESLDKLRTCLSLRRLEVFDCQMISRNGIEKLQRDREDITIHAYFPPHPPVAVVPPPNRRRITCQCCSLL